LVWTYRVLNYVISRSKCQTSSHKSHKDQAQNLTYRTRHTIFKLGRNVFRRSATFY